MNVFVLSPGRSGSLTFAKACGHLSNFTAGHETRTAKKGADRLAYPSRHIESDNRLAWFLGGLGDAFDGKEVLYVHLVRDPACVADSFFRRTAANPTPQSIIRAFHSGIAMRGAREEWPPADLHSVCREYVDTVNANILEFLKGRPRMLVRLGDGGISFREMLGRINARGDIDAALQTWHTVHNRG